MTRCHSCFCALFLVRLQPFLLARFLLLFFHLFHRRWLVAPNPNISNELTTDALTTGPSTDPSWTSFHVLCWFSTASYSCGQVTA